MFLIGSSARAKWSHPRQASETPSTTPSAAVMAGLGEATSFAGLISLAGRTVQAVARSKQVCIEWMEATVLLSIYLSGELIDTKTFYRPDVL